MPKTLPVCVRGQILAGTLSSYLILHAVNPLRHVVSIGKPRADHGVVT